MYLNKIKNIIKTLNVNDRIKITVYDCGTGYAKLLKKTDNALKIQVDKKTWANCYDNQSLESDMFYVTLNEIYEIERRD